MTRKIATLWLALILLGTEQHVVAPIQIGVRAPHALLHHGFQIPLGLALPYVGGLHQMGQGDGVPRTGAGQILGIAAHFAAHDTAAGQQGKTPGQQTRGIHYQQKMILLIVLVLIALDYGM